MIVWIIGACQAGATPLTDSSPTLDARYVLPATASVPPSSPTPSDVISAWMARRPALLAGRYATTDTTAYDIAPLTRLKDEPPITGAVDRLFADTYTYLRLAGPEQLASVSRIVVRGRPIAFSRPYFNSYDGSYWDVSFVGKDAGRDVASEILREVLFDVSEVIANSTDGNPVAELIEFTVRGGQAVITLGSASPAADGDHPLPPGIYVVGHKPEVDLAIGEEMVVFLDYVRLDGLYSQGGTKFGYIYRLMPAHDLYYKWSVDDGILSNQQFGTAGTLDAAELDALIASEHFASAVGPSPDDTIHDQDPPHEP